MLLLRDIKLFVLRYLTRANRLKQFAGLNEYTRRPFLKVHPAQFWRHIFLTTTIMSIDRGIGPVRAMVDENS